MENELIKIFDELHHPIGVATREEVHKKGNWHETFHCWFVSQEDEVVYVYFQIRSASKKDYPNLLDITAAGHILADETIEDGIREVKEELGIEVNMDELISLGVIPYSNTLKDFIDNEFAYVSLYSSKQRFEDFALQKEEVSGIVRATYDTFYDLWLGEAKKIDIDGFEITEDGKKVLINKTVGKESFVPHARYYETVLKLISAALEVSANQRNTPL